MNALRYLIERISSAIEREKQIDKKTFLGDRFEEWVVQWSNIKVDYHRRDNESKLVEHITSDGYWLLQDWRGDKTHYRYAIINNVRRKFKIMANSSLAPDLLLKRVNSSDEVFVECKWRSKDSFLLEKKFIINYHKFIQEYYGDSLYAENPISLDRLFYVFGAGWDKYNPQIACTVQAKKLYEYLGIDFNEVIKLSNHPEKYLVYKYVGNSFTLQTLIEKEIADNVFRDGKSGDNSRRKIVQYY